MKRKISLFCIFLILVTTMAAPAMAADSLLDNFIEVLDYSYPNGSDSNMVTVYSDIPVTFELPSLFTIYYIDIVAVITGDIPSSVSYYDGVYSTSLTIDHIDGQLYRIYGKGSGRALSQISLSFNVTRSWITFISFRISAVDSFIFKAPLEGSGSFPNGTFNMSKNFGDNRPVTTSIVHDGQSFNDRDFTLFLFTEDWRDFDFLQYQVNFIVSDITSVSAVFGETNLPFDSSLIFSSNADSSYYLTVTIDLSGLDRSVDDYPMVIVNGKVVFDGVSSIRLMNSSGIVISNGINPLKYYFGWVSDGFSNLGSIINTSFSNWFTSIEVWLDADFSQWFNSLEVWLDSNFSDWFTSLEVWLDNDFSNWFTSLEVWLDDDFSQWFNSLDSWLTYWFNQLNYWLDKHSTNIISAIRGDTAPGDRFQDEVDQKDQELDDLVSVMDSVTRPAVDQIDLSVDSYVTPADVTMLTTPLLVFFTGDLFGPIVIMTILMATVSYVLFGKR